LTEIQQLNQMTMPKARIRFCELYMVSFDVVDAFRRAYPDSHYTGQSAVYKKARSILRRKDVQLYVGVRREQVREEMCLDATRIASELCAVSFAKITDAIDSDGNVLDFDEMSTATQKAIKKITTKTVETERAGTFTTTKTTVVEMHDKLKGLDMTMRLLGVGDGDGKVVQGDDNSVTNNYSIAAADLTTEQLKQLSEQGMTFDMDDDVPAEPEPIETKAVDVLEDDGLFT